MTEEGETRKIGPLRIPRRIQRISWRDLAASLGPVLLVSVVAIWIAVHFVRPAPPDTIIITSGSEGSIDRTTAERYRTILVRNGIKLEILPSQGSLENLKRLADPKFNVDVGFVQGGLSSLVDTGGLVSLGSVFYEAVVIFYRAAAPIDRLSELKGRRVAIGPEGSGTRFLALALLKANGIEPKRPTRLLELGGQDAAQALLKHEIDAAFLMGDSASPASIRTLLHTRGIRLFNFTQADAYVRRFRYLSKLDLPPGALDLGSNLPPRTLALLAPTVELIARPDLHPALSDLLIEAAREVHGRAAAVVLVPIIVVLIPGLRLVPTIYGWRIKTRIYRRYGELMALERAALSQPSPEERAELLKRLDEIERTVITAKMPGSVADQLYVLRQHITWVRERLGSPANATGAS